MVPAVSPAAAMMATTVAVLGYCGGYWDGQCGSCYKSAVVVVLATLLTATMVVAVTVAVVAHQFPLVA